MHEIIEEIRTSNAQNGLSGNLPQITNISIATIDNYFLNLTNTKKKITLEEENNLKKNLESNVKKLNAYLCLSNLSGCTQNFIDELVVPLLEIFKEQWKSTVEYWLKHIFYLYKTVNSFSGERVSFDYLIDKNLDLKEIFENIQQMIEKSIDKQITIEAYKKDLYNLRKEIIATFTKDNYLFDSLKKITFSKKSEPPISALLEINKQIIDKLIEYDKNMFDNIKMAMKAPLNVVSNPASNPQYSTTNSFSLNSTASNTTDNFQYVNSTENLFRLNSVSPSNLEIKKAALFEEISPQNWTFAGIGFALGGLIIASTCYFFNKRKQQPETTHEVKANKEYKSLIV